MSPANPRALVINEKHVLTAAAVWSAVSAFTPAAVGRLWVRVGRLARRLDDAGGDPLRW